MRDNEAAPRLRGMRVISGNRIFAVGLVKGLLIFAATGYAAVLALPHLNFNAPTTVRGVCDQAPHKGYLESLEAARRLSRTNASLEERAGTFRIIATGHAKQQRVVCEVSSSEGREITARYYTEPR